VRWAALLGIAAAGCGRIGFAELTGDAPLGYAGTVLADQPVAYWRLDDVASGVAKDSSPSALDGSYVGAVVSVAGTLSDGDAAAGLDGTATTYVLFVDDPRLEPGLGSFTFEVWVRVSSVAWNGYVDLLAKRDGCGTTDSFWNVIGYPSGTLVSELRDTTLSKAYDIALGVPDASWHHYVHVLDRAGGSITIYVDGAAAGTVTAAGLGSVAVAAPLRSGCATTPLGVTYALDELAIYDQALSAGRVAAHYQAR